MKTVAFLPVKGESNRVKNKNLRIFNGEPLFVFTLRKLLRCSLIDEVYIDSENESILKTGQRLGAIPLRRNPELATNKTDGNALFLNQINKVNADIYIQHLCTSPFVKDETISKSIRCLQENEKYDSVVLGCQEKRYHWDSGMPVYDIEHIPNSVDLPWEETEAMALYVVRGDAAHKTRRRIGEKPLMLYGDPMELIDINTEEDLKLASIVGAGLLAEEEKRLKLLGRFLSSSILSDTADELGITAVFEGNYSCNIHGGRVFGRARTLHLRKADSDDPPDSIYDALQSYKQVVSNDIIVVKNDLEQYAYFGELNMSLAIRSGAVGAIVSGVTRDNGATAAAGFPVFAKGKSCKDVKGRGAVESINEPITVDGVSVCPSDLIFGDEDGVVVIPRSLESEMLTRALSVMATESKIVADVCTDIDVDSLVSKYGFF